jgi:hypothetical protein
MVKALETRLQGTQSINPRIFFCTLPVYCGIWTLLEQSSHAPVCLPHAHSFEWVPIFQVRRLWQLACFAHVGFPWILSGCHVSWSLVDYISADRLIRLWHFHIDAHAPTGMLASQTSIEFHQADYSMLFIEPCAARVANEQFRTQNQTSRTDPCQYVAWSSLVALIKGQTHNQYALLPYF